MVMEVEKSSLEIELCINLNAFLLKKRTVKAIKTLPHRIKWSLSQPAVKILTLRTAFSFWALVIFFFILLSIQTEHVLSLFMVSASCRREPITWRWIHHSSISFLALMSYFSTRFLSSDISYRPVQCTEIIPYLCLSLVKVHL